MVLSLHSVREVDELVAQAQAVGRTPSLIAAVIRGGGVAHVSAAGETPVPDRDTQYRIGSITKSLTAALIVGLRDEGRLALDDLLGDHLPETALTRVRLRQLLSHSAGMQREPEGDWWERSPGGSVDRLLAATTAAKLAFGPYDRFHYSNLAYGLLGGVIERLTGQSWWEAVSERLLGPLGLTRTTYHPTEPFARGYLVHPWHQTMREEPREDAVAMAPAGQLWSTVDDMARWAAVLADDDPPVLSAASIAELATPAVIADPQAWTLGYGLGLHLWRRGERVFAGHTGSMPGYLSVLVTHRPTNTGVVVFANSYRMRGLTIGGLGLSILEAVLDAEPPPPPTPWRPGAPPPVEVAHLCGRWWWMGHEVEAHWDEAAGELVLTDGGEVPWCFTQEQPDRWRGRTGRNAGEVLEVRRDSAGVVVGFELATFIFTRDPDLVA
jgi:CubicO group peptidase (beta-lactamase class C family)